MPRLFPCLLSCVCLAALGFVGTARCSPDIEVEKTADGPLYYFSEKKASKERTLFWNPKEKKSDVGYSADGNIQPGFFWSADRDYLAVNGGSAQEHQVFLYRVQKGILTPVDVAPFTRAQSTPLRKLKGEIASNGIDALRWTGDGTLLIHVWAESSLKEANGKPGSANFWAELAMEDGRAETVSVSDADPSGKAEAEVKEEDPEDHLDPKKLAGTHVCKGTNPDGSKYEGDVTIRFKNGLALFEWEIDGKKSHGTGLLEGMTLGVALDDGLAIYQVFPQAEGFSLIGLWASEGSEEASHEVILVDNADMEKARIPASKFNGSYAWLRESSKDDPEEGTAKITGEDASKTVTWTIGKKKVPGQGLALGEGLAVIRPDGLAVYQLLANKNGKAILSGHSLQLPLNIFQETLTPEAR